MRTAMQWSLELCVQCAEEHHERHNTHEQESPEEDRSRGSHLVAHNTSKRRPNCRCDIIHGHEETEPYGSALRLQYPSGHRQNGPCRGTNRNSYANTKEQGHSCGRSKP